MFSKTHIYIIKALFLVAILSSSFFSYIQVKNYIPTKAGVFYSGKKYYIAGENTQGFCQLINNQSCEKHPEQKYTDFEQTLCETNQNCTASKKALNAVLSGSVDLASVESKDVTFDVDVKALMHLTTDQKMLLVSRKDFPYEDGLHVVKTVHDFITSIRSNSNSFKNGKALKIAPVYGGDDALERYIKFDKGYILHSGLVAYYLPRLETPLKITTGIEDCDPDYCTYASYVSDVPKKDYREANRIAKMGKGLIPYLKQAIKSDNDFLVMKAAHAMGRIWPREPDLLTALLLELLDHPNDEVKEQAIYALSAQKPLHSETIDRLIQLAESNPIEREGFSDGSHGMSQQIIVLRQRQLSEITAYQLATIDQDSVLPVLYKLATSKNLKKQTIGINAINQYLAREVYKITTDMPIKEQRDARENGYNFSQSARDALQFLKENQTNFTEENKKNVERILTYHPISDTRITNILIHYPSTAKNIDTKSRKQEVYDLLYTFNLHYKTWE